MDAGEISNSRKPSRIYAADPQSLDNIMALADSYRAVSEKLLSSGQLRFWFRLRTLRDYFTSG